MRSIHWLALAAFALLAANEPTQPPAKPPASPSPAPAPTYADAAYGPHPHQVLDLFLPAQGVGPFPVVINYTTLWVPGKRTPGLGWYAAHRCALAVVELRSMKEAAAKNVDPPVSYCLLDARRALQFVRLNAAKWNLDPARIAVTGSSQGALPALFVACSGEKADPTSSDPVERVSTRVVCAACSIPGAALSIDPQRAHAWVPEVKWGEPAWGCKFDEALARREDLLPKIRQWSPDWLLSGDDPPIYLLFNAGLTKPADQTEMQYLVHSPRWGIEFQKLAAAQGATCYVDYPGHPVQKYLKGMWDGFMASLLSVPSK